MLCNPWVCVSSSYMLYVGKGYSSVFRPAISCHISPPTTEDVFLYACQFSSKNALLRFPVKAGCFQTWCILFLYKLKNYSFKANKNSETQLDYACDVLSRASKDVFQKARFSQECNKTLFCIQAWLDSIVISEMSISNSKHRSVVSQGFKQGSCCCYFFTNEHLWETQFPNKSCANINFWLLYNQIPVRAPCRTKWFHIQVPHFFGLRNFWGSMSYTTKVVV